MSKLVVCPVFECADRFFRSAELLEQQAMSDTLTYGTPAIVNLAFSIELFLKTVYMLENKAKAPKKHKFTDLYEKLTFQSKEEIRDGFDRKRTGEKEFCFLLSYYSNLFEEWRYAYEDYGINYVRFQDLKLMAEVIRSRCNASIEKAYRNAPKRV